MDLPYYLGCPSWSENAWREYLYPKTPNPTFSVYSQVFNAVEGNTTFYAALAGHRAALGRDHARTLSLHRQVSRRHQPQR
jgi:hypothetical protein